MSESNLSKTKPALRTKGGVTGNFGAGRRKAGTKYSDVPANNRESLGSFPTQDEYRQRLLQAYQLTSDPELRRFIRIELTKLTPHPEVRVDAPPQGPYCPLHNHHVSNAQ